MSRDEAVALAIRLANEGRVGDAERLSSQLIAQFPEDLNTVAMRAFVLHRTGRLDDAIGLLEATVAANDNLPVFHSNLCEMYRQRKQPQAARPHGERAVALAPNYADAHNNLGIVLFELKDYERAEACYRKAIELKPAFAEPHNNLGNLLRVREDVAGSLALYEEAVRLRPTYVEALTNAGRAHLSQRHFDEAERLFRQATAAKPDHVEALTGIAAAAHGKGNEAYAMTLVSRLTSMYPTSLEPYLMMAQLLLEDHKLNGALAAVKQALDLDGRSAKALAMMGRVKREMGQTEESVDWFAKAAEADPDSAEFPNQMGVSYLELGELEKARQRFEEAIAMAPESLRIYTNLAAAKKFSRDDETFGKFLKAAEKVDTLPDHERVGVHYALGKAYDDAGEPARAMDAFIEGARLKHAELNYQKAPHLFMFDRIREVFSREAIEARRAEITGSSTEAPIFIVGMPRSGSTLTEQILSSHSQVFGAGEVRTLYESIHRTVSRDFGDAIRFPEVFRFMGQSHADEIVTRYLADVPNWHGGTPRVTDKMLSNYFYVGFIHLIMPRATIIHIRRNPIDTCVSCFTRLFREDLPYSYDFDDLADYYLKYAELMAHWRSVLPEGAFHELRYEDLVNDTEATARRLLDRAGLPWEEQCLAFHENRRAIKTASVTQVREPIYTRSVDRWRKYGAAVQPLVDRLAAIEY
jgi:tetratricopeptide (TPR) repeat protein